jgi:hypothetical protein
MEASPNEARAVFHNSRTIGVACECRDGDGQQLVGGGLRMYRCWLPLCHGNPLARIPILARPTEIFSGFSGATSRY